MTWLAIAVSSVVAIVGQNPDIDISSIRLLEFTVQLYRDHTELCDVDIEVDPGWPAPVLN